MHPQANEHSSDPSVPKRIVAINTQMYKRTICECKQGEPQKCSNAKKTSCSLLCYMTRLDNPGAYAEYTDNNHLMCQSSRTNPASEVKITTGEYPGTACCYKECNIRNPFVSSALNKVLPNMTNMVSPPGQPSSWSKMSTIVA